jgi:3-hydroxyacyl-CoA dehydrogenase
MDMRIERAAVIGSGVMGSALAAHLANAGIPTLLLDIVPPAGSGIEGDASSRAFRNALAARGLGLAVKSKPAAFFTPAGARLVAVGNLEDDLARLSDADWVLEAIVEKLEIKESLFERIAPHLKDGAIVTTNTSGLSITDMAAVLPEAVRPRFLGTHFFNPPRYLHLLELVPHDGTDRELLAAFARFGEDVLGKGVVTARDTPNFIANRIGGFTVMSAMHAMVEGGYTVEEVDALTGPLLGRPKSASFRTVDLVGLDTFVHASTTVYDRAVDDAWRAAFKPPVFVDTMLARGMLGEKSGGGFYKKVKRDGASEILTLDIETFNYRERRKAAFPSLETAKAIEGLGERVAAAMGAKDRAGEFVWRTLSETLLYAAERIGDITDDVAEIDRAMRWGFGWVLGPFELWDAVGVAKTAERMDKDGRDIPPIVRAVLATPHKRFYGEGDGGACARYLGGRHRALEPLRRHIDLAALKANGARIDGNSGASLVDIGDGVACLEFHSKMNAIGEDIIAMVHKSVKRVEADFDALVVGNQGTNFSVGANVMLLLLEAQEGNWEEIDLMVRSFQKATMALKYCRKPVVAAPFGMTLGGGCEMVLGAGHAFADAETYMGLVEVGVGLIPAGGGCKEMVLRNLAGRPDVKGVDVFPYVRGAFEAIGMARVSTGAVDAFAFKMLRGGDSVCMNSDQLLFGARETAKGLAARGYRRPDPAVEVPVAGESGFAAFETQLYNMTEGGYISEYDAHVGRELARVLCGGALPAGTMVNEQYFLDLEREAFLRLCGEKKTHERMAHMLKKGRPLRN